MKQTRRDFMLVSAGLLAVPLLSGAGQQLPQRRIDFNTEQTEDLNRISAWLNGLATLTASFVQTNAQGRTAHGTFYLARPGRLRFEYRPPSPLLIVATGGNFYVRNNRLNTVDHYSASDTPLGLLLDGNIDLKRNPAVLGIERREGALVLHARSATNRMSENITVTFAAPDIQLRQWVVKDLQGDPTTVVLTEAQTGMALPDTLFAKPVQTPAMRTGTN
ncbi:MAG: outer membrane lipoprotein carrier protein LolA [Alphaproteobacteria bacterium]|nr:outer membrane lipoprotein carrier protein LolA [Alphaproteobacteria bacterium]